MIEIIMYIGFALWFVAGISTGKMIESKRRLKKKMDSFNSTVPNNLPKRPVYKSYPKPKR